MKRFLLALLLLGISAAGVSRAAAATPNATPAPAQPRLIDLGADKCIPCRMMTPILAELARDYRGQLEVVFIDVWKNPAEGERYRIAVIPTQIFLDAAGQELFRHEGFLAKKDILAKWSELGVKLTPPASTKS